MDYLITFEDGSTAYLAHHGVLGMKWGVRNAETQAKYDTSKGGSWRESKKLAKRLNRLDKERAVNIGKIETAERKARKAQTAMDNAKTTGNTKRVAKLEAKSKKHEATISSYRARQREITSQYGAATRAVLANGHQLRLTMVTRSTMSAGQKAANAGLVALQMASPSPVVIYRNPRALGLKFKAEKKRNTSGKHSYATEKTFA